MKYNFSTRGCSGLIYDGVNIADIFQIVDISIPLLPTFTAVTQDLAQRPGSYFSTRKVETREIRIKLRLDAESRDPMDIFKAWRSVSDIFNKPTPCKLFFNEDKYLWALFVGESTIENNAYYGDVEFSFVAFDPYFYGVEHEINVKAGETEKFTVQGGVEAYPVFNLTATTTSVTITNLVSGDFVTIPNTKSGSKVTVDMARQRATIGGAYAPVNLLSDFFSVDDIAQIKVTGANGTLTYQERFL